MAGTAVTTPVSTSGDSTVEALLTNVARHPFSKDLRGLDSQIMPVCVVGHIQQHAESIEKGKDKRHSDLGTIARVTGNYLGDSFPHRLLHAKILAEQRSRLQLIAAAKPLRETKRLEFSHLS